MHLGVLRAATSQAICCLAPTRAKLPSCVIKLTVLFVFLYNTTTTSLTQATPSVRASTLQTTCLPNSSSLLFALLPSLPKVRPAPDCPTRMPFPDPARLCLQLPATLVLVLALVPVPMQLMQVPLLLLVQAMPLLEVPLRLLVPSSLPLTGTAWLAMPPKRGTRAPLGPPALRVTPALLLPRALLVSLVAPPAQWRALLVA